MLYPLSYGACAQPLYSMGGRRLQRVRWGGWRAPSKQHGTDQQSDECDGGDAGEPEAGEP